MKLIYKNSLSGIGQLVLTGLLTFVSIPVFIRVLGEEAYGAFSIVTLAGNLSIFVNLGLNSALLKFLCVQGRSKESDYDIVATLLLLIVIVVPLSVLAITFQQPILQRILGMSDRLYDQVRILYRCVVLANLVLLIGQTFTTLLDSQQRIYLTNMYQFIYSLLYWGGMIGVVSLGYGMPAVGGVVLGAATVWLALVSIAALTVWGKPDLTGFWPALPRIARKQLAFGASVYSAGLLTMLFEPMTKLLVSRLIGVTEVGYLEIAHKIRSQLWAVMQKMTYPLYPQIAQQTDIGVIHRMMNAFQSRMLVLIVPFLLFFFLALPSALSLWLPNANETTTLATLCISSAYMLGTLSIPPYYFLMSHQHGKKTVLVQAVNVTVNGLVILLSYQWMGFDGVILANSLAILSSLTVCLYFQKRYVGPLQFGVRTQWLTWLALAALTFLLTLVGQQLTNAIVRIGFIGLAALLTYAVLLRDDIIRFTSRLDQQT
jgi:O-antigen/teichoic acid export membrane protein